MEGYVRVTGVQEIPEGAAKCVQFNDLEIAIFRIEGRYYALDNTCPHLGGPISEGTIRDKLVTCPWHEWSFDISSGRCTINPAAYLKRYALKVIDDEIWVAVEPIPTE